MWSHRINSQVTRTHTCKGVCSPYKDCLTWPYVDHVVIKWARQLLCLWSFQRSVACKYIKTQHQWKFWYLTFIWLLHFWKLWLFSSTPLDQNLKMWRILKANTAANFILFSFFFITVNSLITFSVVLKRENLTYD